MSSPPRISRELLLRWALFVPIAAALIAHSLVFDFVNDDAYISFVYARNLADHGELVFNLGERVEGYTNFLWTVLLAGFFKLGIRMDWSARVLGTLFGLAGLVTVVRLSAGVRGKKTAADFLPAALLAACSGYACWCSGGLETQMFTFFALLGLERLWAKDTAWSGVAFALCAMTRPEGNLLFALAVLHQVIASGRRPSRPEWLWISSFVLLYAPYFAWRYMYYGYLFPNTAYVKTGGVPPPGYAAQMHAQGAYYVWQWATQSMAVYAAPLVVLATVWRPRFASLVWLITAVYLLYAWRVGGDFMGLHRFVMPLFPLVALAACIGLVDTFDKIRAPWPVTALAGLLLVGGFGYTQAELTRSSLEPRADRGIDRPGYLALYSDNRGAIGRALRPHFTAEDLSWVGGVGVQPYYGHMRAYDVFGLVSTRVAHEVAPSRPRPGHQKWAPPQMVLETDPTFIFYCYAIHTDEKSFRLCGEAGFFQGRGYEPCTLFVPGAQNEAIQDRQQLLADSAHRPGMYYTFLKKKERDFPCLQSAAAPR
jgi:arabinofuranosyltransferase